MIEEQEPAAAGWEELAGELPQAPQPTDDAQDWTLTTPAESLRRAGIPTEDADAADLAAAQRELDAACEEVGATLGCIRAPGGVSAAALRAVARTIRETSTMAEKGARDA